MAFLRSGLALIHRAPRAGISLWRYAHTDDVTVVVAANYFNAAAKEFRKGDIIFAECNSGTPSSEVLSVTSNSGAAVVVVRNAT
jgi:hypothetical protein